MQHLAEVAEKLAQHFSERGYEVDRENPDEVWNENYAVLVLGYDDYDEIPSAHAVRAYLELDDDVNLKFYNVCSGLEVELYRSIEENE
jgi:hypothetical protein